MAEALVPPQPAEAEAQQRAALLVDSLSSRLNLREPLSLTVRGRACDDKVALADGHSDLPCRVSLPAEVPGRLIHSHRGRGMTS